MSLRSHPPNFLWIRVFFLEGVSIEVDPTTENVTLVLEDQSVTVSADTSLVAPESEMDVDA